MSTEMYLQVSPLTDKYNDFGFDLNYEKSLGDNQFTAHTSLYSKEEILMLLSIQKDL